ncbi:UDP-forming cellulose synthase catalytic subunit [Leptolyngbya ohadii]|uniref:UDP-forming cellulose synthase catalytic subunit n=1 Tax=Leptolyngbya ohadii TaxID=1962290 RepID=UPI000B5A04B1|nr:UDP-forming cellulose synthase catalytic subunit [Leptolyngbya ohadii]
MTKPLSRKAFRPTQKRLEQLNNQFADLLIDRLPDSVNSVLQWLGRSQLVLLLVCLVMFFAPFITVRPNIWQQALLGACVVGVGRWFLHLAERPQSKSDDALHLLLMLLSILTTLRYLYYRVSYTLNFDTWVDAFFSLLLFAAELYGILTLFLAYFQTLKIRERKPVDLSLYPQEDWFTVDIYIPTYNEDVDIVRKTTLAAMAIDYPADKKRVYVLDDGRAEKYKQRRAKLWEMCEELGCTMLTRDNNDHAKAGNINTALHKTKGDLVMILDCDHIPIRGFLQKTVGFFFDPKVALVQTPHWFYNPDPFERNLYTNGQIPVGNELFYKVLQKGNDFWNAAFFCGSAAVIRREAILEVGGIATETVTEDCHTSLRLHSIGYKSVYYDKIMVAGLAPETFSSFVGQQVRWARGMAQILRLENPLFNRKLKLRMSQRLCYFSATMHFFFGFPRVMYAIAPTFFLLFGINSVKGLGVETLVYALPHIILSMQTNHIPYKHVRFSFWNEIYEFAMSFQAGIVTMLALVNPKLGSFNVTSKGLTVNERSFDLDSIRYLVLLGTITAASLLAIPFWLIISPQETQAVLINALWCLFNLLLVLAACLAAFEQPQLRRAHRLPRRLLAIIHNDGRQWIGNTTNVSETGAQILLEEWPNVPDEVRVELVGDYGARALLDARIVRGLATESLETSLSIDFVNLTQEQKDDLTLVLYADVREWYSQRRSQIDKPIESLRFIATSLKRAFRELKPEVGVKVRKQVRGWAQVFWEGWEDEIYTARVTEIGTRDLRIEFVDRTIPNLATLESSQPILSLMLSREGYDPLPQSLLAQVQSLEILPTLLPDAESGPEGTQVVTVPTQRIIMELTFPESLDRQQREKIRKVLRLLG